MSKVGGAAGSAPGPTAAAAAAAVQKQKSLLQKADADVSSLVDNFSSLINIARVNDPPVRNSQEAFQMEMRAARMMASLNGNHEDKDNERNTNVSPAASSFECKMLEYMAAQTQTLQAMAQTMINIHQYITEEATSSKNHNPVSGNNHQISSVPPPFDKEKLSNMQAQVLQGQKQTNTSPPCNTEMTKAGVPTGPVKKQVVEAWNNQKNKRSHGVPEMLMKKQHEVINTIVTCQCCEYYGHSCLQEETSLMTPKARQRYLLDINRKRKLSTQDPAPEGVAQAEDNTRTMNLEDWSISFKEYQPVRSKQSKKQTSKAIQEKKELSHTMADSTTQPSSNRPQPKVVQPPHDISISENTNAKAIPPRAMVEQEGSQDGCLAISFKQRDIMQQCCNRSKSGHHTRRCPTKQNVDKSQWSCHNCGKEGLLAEQCPLNQEYRKKSLNALAREGCCGETVQSPKRSKLSISRKQEQFGGDVYEKVDK